MKFIFSNNLRQGFAVNIFIGIQEANRGGGVSWIDVATNIRPDISKWTIVEKIRKQINVESPTTGRDGAFSNSYK